MNKDEFEQLIQSSADQYRMFPSDKVWKNIHKEMHVYRKWRITGLVTMLVSIGVAVTWVMKTYHLPAENSINAGIQKTNIITPASITEKKRVFTYNKISGTEKITAPVNLAVSETALAPIFHSGQQEGEIELPLLANKVLITQEPEGSPQINNIVDWEPQVNIPSLPEPIREKVLSIGIPEDKVAINNAKKPVQEIIRPTNALEDDKATAYATHYLIPGIESITNEYKAPPKEWTWQFYFSSGISYRHLSDNKSYTLSVAPYANLQDVNQEVNHRPDIGFQVGLTAKYPVSRKVNVKAGLQFNVNKYDVSVYDTKRQEKATIELADGLKDSKVDTWTTLRNYGNNYDWIKNFYSSISAPIGAEVVFGKGNKTKWGVAGTIQPTFLIGDRVYMLSTDFKNYTKVDWLVRRVNIAAGFEAFAKIKSGKTSFQIGPQIRYNLLSSFQSKYPISENIYDAGIKLGVTLNK